MSYDIRPAKESDARVIARLFQVSSAGVANYVWSLLRDDYDPDCTLLDIGEKRYARSNTDFSYQNCLLVETEGHVVGMLHSFPIGSAVEPPPDEFDPILRPYAELEEPNSLYIAGVALFEEHRGRGLGTRLMGEALERARREKLPKLSLIAFEQNRGAVGLYESLGYRAKDRRTVVPHDYIRYTGEAILMVRATD